MERGIWEGTEVVWRGSLSTYTAGGDCGGDLG